MLRLRHCRRPFSGWEIITLCSFSPLVAKPHPFLPPDGVSLHRALNANWRASGDNVRRAIWHRFYCERGFWWSNSLTQEYSYIGTREPPFPWARPVGCSLVSRARKDFCDVTVSWGLGGSLVVWLTMWFYNMKAQIYASIGIPTVLGCSPGF